MLDMTTAQLHSVVLGAEECLHSLQLRLETHTQNHIAPLSQELLLETGNSLDPRELPSQRLPDGLVCGAHTSANILDAKETSKMIFKWIFSLKRLICPSIKYF